MDLEEVIKEIEEDKLFTRGITSKIFKSMLNQPSLVSVNSANAEKIDSENGYYTFKINFTRPILDVDTIQLLTTSIPQANASIPNTAITFWYYRLSGYTGTTPSLNNLYCVRLLPSYYKPEFITSPETYGWNKTFNSYQKLSDELAKSCATDLGYFNLVNYLEPNTSLPDSVYKFPFLPNDITIAYNPTYNRFQMTGNTTRFAQLVWSAGTTYIAGSVVYWTNDRTYTSLQNSNTNHNPTSSPTWWQETSNEIIADWDANTLYAKGNIVYYADAFLSTWIALRDTRGDIPPDSGDDWANVVVNPPNVAYTYLITGYDDPNVAIKQGKLFNLPYEPTHYYQTGERVFDSGRVFRATTETSIFTPGNIDQRNTTNPIVYYQGTYRRQVVDQPIQNWTVLTPNPINVPIWSQFQSYEVNDLVYDGSLMFKCLIANTDDEPSANISNGKWILQAQHPYDATPYQDVGANLYNAGDCATYAGQLWVANQPIATSPASPYWTALGYTVWNNYNYSQTTVYSNGDVVYFNGQYYNRNATTLNAYPPVPKWNSKTFYPANTIIQSGNNVFRCLLANQGNQPQFLANTWSAGTTYEIGQTAVVNNIPYVCQVKHRNLNPTNPVPDWTNATAYVPFNIAFVPGVQSYRCTNPVGPSPTPPNGDGGNWQGVFGGNNISNVWLQSNTAYWQSVAETNWDPTTMESDQSGLSGLSKICDFLDHDGVGGVRPEFPEGIPPQPFNPEPERLLNSILGFTWNGIFTPSVLSDLSTEYIQGRFISLYNRLRPVPPYIVIPAPTLLDDPAPTSTITRTYTAEGYANLVYSSIVNIYTNIIGGSTLDTVRNTNLVATTSMNCGNLGIAFHGNYIDTPLQRVAGDINEITIELRDEVGEPFFLTNNAIMTATFKITYKDGGVRIEEPA